MAEEQFKRRVNQKRKIIMAKDKKTALPNLSLVENWIFDLDNTIYPAACNLFAQIDQRMGEFVSDFLGLSLEEAKIIQKQYYYDHGTTLSGLMIRHDMEPANFLDYVHKIDVSHLPQDPALDDKLARLPGRKLIFTNGTVAHAENVLNHMGVRHHFSDIVDIVATDYVPKPHQKAYDCLISRTGIDPTKSALLEDIARNLEPAHLMGMKCILIATDNEWASIGSDGDHIHHVADELGVFLDAALSVIRG